VISLVFPVESHPLEGSSMADDVGLRARAVCEGESDILKLCSLRHN
jgi:hypothetical protein